MARSKYRWILIVAVAAISIAAITVAISTTRETMKENELLALLILNDSNKIATYNPPHSINLAGNEQNQQVRIVHFGDSHIQAGTFTKKLRELLSAYLNENEQSEGYIFPFNIAKTNSPCAYTFETNAEWAFDKLTLNKNSIDAGLAGIYIETNSPNATLTIKLTGYAAKNSSFNKVRVYFGNSTQSYIPQIADSLLVGISEGYNYKEFTLKAATQQVQVTLAQTNNKQTHFKLTGLQVENSNSKLVYNAAGLNGATAKTYLRAQELIPQIASLTPNLIIISLGTNDAYNDAFNPMDFMKELNNLVKNIHTAVPTSAILLTTPGDHYWMKEYSNPNLTATRETIIKVAAKNGCYTWDLFNIMGGAGSMDTWKNEGYSANDMIHFTNRGYNLQAEMLFNALTGEKSRLNSLPIANR